MTIETKLPITIIKTGIFDGRLNARRRPVTRADPSVIETGFLRMNFCTRYSKRKHERTEVDVTIAAPSPK
jgi:hypothetical protein